MKCPECSRDFPPELLSELATGRDGQVLYQLMCPPCALAAMNAQDHLPADTPFNGPQARRMHAEALLHLKATGQEGPP